MSLPPAILVHGLPHARLALAPGRPVTLLSAPGAASYAGCGWWRAVVAAALAGCPGVDAPDVLDCGDAPGRALEALSLGCRWLVLRPGPSWEDISARAALQGAQVLPAAPRSLDLSKAGSERRVAAWLGISAAAGVIRDEAATMPPPSPSGKGPG